MEKYNSSTFYGWSEAKSVKVDIKNAKYLKLTADDNSDNWWSAWYDEAVCANAKLIKEDYKVILLLDIFLTTIFIE